MKKTVLTCMALVALSQANAQRFTPNLSTNPNGPWSFGMGVVGGQFAPFTQNITTGATSDVVWAKSVPEDDANAMQAIIQHRNAAIIPASQSVSVPIKQNDVLMHPGNTKEHLSIIRFTAPAAGNYKVKVVYNAIHPKAAKSYTYVYTNAASQQGKSYSFTPAGFKEIFTQALNGPNAKSVFERSIQLKANEVLSFEVGNGGDSYVNDLVKADISVEKI
ncbi:MAG: hypothetical protein V4561_04335 [Bacteroidota bacterium]